MTLRQSVNDPNNPVADGNSVAAGGMSDFQSVDDTPGILSVLWSLTLKVWWAFVIIGGLAAVSFPYFFPEWADKHKNALVEMGTVANSLKFIENANSVQWSEALTAENIKGLYLVGTGQHPVFDGDPGLKAGTWYMGNDLLIMKEPVPMYAFMNFWTDSKDYQATDTGLLPATDIEYMDAVSYCGSIDGRLPTLPEIVRAYRLAFTKSWQGKTGDFLKPNLTFMLSSQFRFWTSTVEEDGFFGGDNYAAYRPGDNSVVYEDDGYNSEDLSFLCVREIKEQK